MRGEAPGRRKKLLEKQNYVYHIRHFYGIITTR